MSEYNVENINAGVIFQVAKSSKSMKELKKKLGISYKQIELVLKKQRMDFSKLKKILEKNSMQCKKKTSMKHSKTGKYSKNIVNTTGKEAVKNNKNIEIIIDVSIIGSNLFKIIYEKVCYIGGKIIVSEALKEQLEILETEEAKFILKTMKKNPKIFKKLPISEKDMNYNNCILRYFQNYNDKNTVLVTSNIALAISAKKISKDRVYYYRQNYTNRIQFNCFMCM